MARPSDRTPLLARRDVLGTVAASTLLLGGGRAAANGMVENDAPTIAAGERFEIAANPDAGFQYPYLLYVPDSALGSPRRLLVEPNNTGESTDDLDRHRERAEGLLSEGGPTRRLCEELDVPAIVPIFPRPSEEPVDWRHYTHALDRQTLEIEDGPLERIDEQLLAMVDDAKQRMTADLDLITVDGMLLTGFSASGNFVNRFAAIHPDRVRAMIAGGINGTLVLPRMEVDGRVLNYHVGVADLEALVGEPFDLEAWQAVDQFVYLGGDDNNDTIPYDDAWSEDQRELALDIYGEHMQEDRMPTCREIYEEAGFRGWHRTFPNVGHSPVEDAMVSFFRRHTESVSVGVDRPPGIGDDAVDVDMASWPTEDDYEVRVFDADGTELSSSPQSFPAGTVDVENVALDEPLGTGESVVVAAVDPGTPTLEAADASEAVSADGMVEITAQPVAGDKTVSVTYELAESYVPEGQPVLRVETEEGGAYPITDVDSGDEGSVTADLDGGLGVPLVEGRTVSVVIVDDDPMGVDPVAVDSREVGTPDESIADVRSVDIPRAAAAGTVVNGEVEVRGIGGSGGDPVPVRVLLESEVLTEVEIAVEPGASERLDVSFAAPDDGGEVDLEVTAGDQTETVPLIVAELPDEGAGTDGDPYRVSTATEFAFAITEPERHFALIDDIDLSVFTEFARIGTADERFVGSLDGQGHRLIGPIVREVPDRFEGVGVFGNLGGNARIHDLQIEDAVIDGGDTEFVGIVAGAASDDVHIDRVSTSGEVTGGRHVGGIVGGSTSGGDFTIVESTSDATITAVGNTSGGIIGQLSGHTIERCSFTGALTDDGGNGGGIVGLEWFGGAVVQCFASGSIEGGNGLIGGVNDGGQAIDSYWDVEATGQDSSPGGGTGLSTDEMTGDSAPDHMTALDFGTTWEVTAWYPRLRWLDEETLRAAVSVDPVQAEPGTELTFDGGSSIGDITSFAWSSPDLPEFTESGEIVHYTVEEPGEFAVSLTVTTADGNEDTTTVIVVVADPTDTWIAFAEEPQAGDDVVVVSGAVAKGIDEESLRVRVGTIDGEELTEGPLTPVPGESFDEALLMLDRSIEGEEELVAVVQPSGGFDPNDAIASTTVTVDESVDDDVAALEEKLAEKIAEIHRLEDELASAQGEYEAIVEEQSTAIEELEEELASVRAERSSLEEELEELKGDLDDRDDDPSATEESADDEVPGFGAFAALGAIGGVGYLLRRSAVAAGKRDEADHAD